MLCYDMCLIHTSSITWVGMEMRCHDGTELGHSQTDAASIGLIVAQFWPISAC